MSSLASFAFVILSDKDAVKDSGLLPHGARVWRRALRCLGLPWLVEVLPGNRKMFFRQM